ncbi:PorT family protein [Hymenobacter sp. BT175]|uniref:outer membrane beta-barrel protein n=1 Tax=Hymenobacter translucens TaxID=2886507 RepID=UPI001D0E46B4|nr:outer membrane beta-barrel protein [Hymenobacter translucens]MCC2547514.1 PorT family protein [Hymenobacter translucens]
MNLAYALAFTFCLFSTLGVRAQSDAKMQPGYIVTLRGDTVRGLLSASRFVSENGLQFKPSNADPVKVYFPAELRGFGEQGTGRYYVSRRMGLYRTETTITTRSDLQYRRQREDSTTVFLQPIVTGHSILYGLDFHLTPQVERTAMEASRPQETRFYFLQLPKTPLVALPRAQYKALLQAAFSDCPAAVARAAKSHFSADHLAEVVLTYNACHTGVPARDLRLHPEATNPTTLTWSARAGISRSGAYYDNSAELGSKQTQASYAPLLELRLRLGNKNPYSLETGLRFTTRKSTAANPHTVPAGFTNSGQQLTVKSSTQFSSLQIPVQAHYRFGQGNLQPYVTGGLLAGLNFGHKNALGILVTRFNTPPGSPGSTQEVGTEAATYREGSSQLTYGGIAGAGITGRLGRLTPMLEVSYELNREARATAFHGVLFYRAFNATVGLEF